MPNTRHRCNSINCQFMSVCTVQISTVYNLHKVKEDEILNLCQQGQVVYEIPKCGVKFND